MKISLHPTFVVELIIKSQFGFKLIPYFVIPDISCIIINISRGKKKDHCLNES